jgi:hypothetical protein
LQSDSARPGTEEGISKEEHPATTRKVSAQEPTKTGTTLLVSPSALRPLHLSRFC